MGDGAACCAGTLLAFAIVCAGVLVLRRTDPDLPRPFRAPGMPWVGIGGLAVCLYLMAVLPFATWRRLLVWLAVGLAIYFVTGVGTSRGRARRRARWRAVRESSPDSR